MLNGSKCVTLPLEMQPGRILITGASGFIGGFIVEEALSQGMEVWAAVRRSSSTRYLQDKRIHLIELNLGSTDQMTEVLGNIQFDYVVHAAGLTKALKKSDFFDVNTEGAKHLVTALTDTQHAIKRFVFVSSLSVMGAIREEEPHTDIIDTDTPCPNTSYAESKLLAENWLKEHCRLPFTILRPTGVYGPREKDYMIMADSIRRGIDVAVGYRRQDLTFIFVKDVIQAVFLSIKSEKSIGKAYFLSDGEVYSSRQFSDYIISTLGKRHVLRLTFPLWVLRTVCAVSDIWMRITGKLSTLNNDHYNMLKQRNWRCDITSAKRDLGFSPRWNLEKGVREMLQNTK